MQKQALEGYSLSPQQERLWLIQQGGGSLAYRTACLIEIEGALNTNILKAAVDDVVNRHEILRTTFHSLSGMTIPLQVISGPKTSWGDDCDLSLLGSPELELRIREAFEQAKSLPIDYVRGPILRATLLVISSDRHVLLITLPSLCIDSTRLKTLVSEIGRSYQARANGRELTDEVVQYADLSEVFNSLLESEDTKSGREFWGKRRAGDFERLKLPSEKSNSPGHNFAPDCMSFVINRETCMRIDAVTQTLGVSISDFMLACWQVLLWRLTGESEIVVAVSCAGRSADELPEALGLFVKYLPVTCTLDGGSRFSSVLRHARDGVSEAYKWQEYFGWEHGAQQADRGSANFFPICFDFEDATESSIEGLRFSLRRYYSCTDRFKLRLSCFLAGDSVRTELYYDSARIAEEDMARLSSELAELISSAVLDPEKEIDGLDILGERERRQLLFEFNDTNVAYATDQCMHNLFEQQARANPAAIAIGFQDQELTYRELNARANQLAHLLRSLGVGPEVKVAICLERSLEMVVTLLAVLKAGGAYVPLDPTNPRERLAFILRDTQAPVLITQQYLLEFLPQSDARVISLDRDWQLAAAESDSDPAVTVSSDNLCYVIYTSGSTGKPKGVTVSHRAICNRILWMQNAYPLAESDIVFQKTPFGFDASIWEFFSPLTAGARLILADPGGHQDSRYLVDAIEKHRVTILQLVPSMLQVVLEEEGVERCRTLRRVFSGGEALPGELVDRFYERLGADLHNLYGPTEAAIDVTHCRSVRDRNRDDERIVSIGRPIANTRIYVLDKYLKPTPIGVAGELYIRGEGLARGYLGRADLTAEKFIPNPFDDQGKRLYRSGDRARFLKNGNIEYLGRVDDQVKMRGFRIEPGEIETVLRRCAGVKDAVVVALEQEAGNKRLVAYILSDQNVQQPGSDHSLYRLPNNLEIAHVSKSETDVLYKEIFEDQAYLRHGITISEDDCVFDVGANIGMFTLFAHHCCEKISVYAFEPIPTVFEKLKANLELYGLNVKPYACGVSNKAGVAEFTYYPRMTTMSGYYADTQEDEELTRAYMRNQDFALTQYADELLEGKFEKESFACQLTTVSDVITENSLEEIALLKIDVEKSELDVLSGIREEHWPKIKQIALELHDIDGRLNQVTDMLEARGFDVAVDQDELLRNTNLFNLYAIHPSRGNKAPGQGRKTGWLEPLARKTPLSLTELRDYVGEQLPDYMVPAAFVYISEFPVLPNGKLDRKALPQPDQSSFEQARTFIAPRTPVEEIIASLWTRLLNVDRVSIHDDFFELGAHSLLATQLKSQLWRAFHTQIPLRTIFQSRTIAELAVEVEAARNNGKLSQPPAIQPISRDGNLPLSFAQQRLWFLHEMEPESAAFNIPLAVRLKGDLNIQALEQSFSEIIRRHEVLRTTFASVQGEPIQVVRNPEPIKLVVENLTELDPVARDARLRHLSSEEARAPFDLSRGPLLRVRLLCLETNHHAAFFTLHHIVSDGWSSGIMIKEFAALYDAFISGRPSPLEELRVQYADFAAWQREWLSGDALDAQLGYWKQQLSGAPALLRLPTDRPRPAVQSFKGSTYTFRLDDELTASLVDFSRREGVTLFMTLLAGFQTLLYRYSRQDDVLVGTDVANRNWPQTEGLIGFFINQVVMRGNFSNNPTFKELLAQVCETSLEAYAHQDLPFERLVEELNPDRNLSHAPLFQVKLVLQNVPQGALELPGLTLEPLQYEKNTSQLDLIMSLNQTERGIIGEIEYSTDLFDESTIDRMREHFENLLRAIIANPDQRIADLRLLAGEELMELSNVDFADADLSMNELENVLMEINQLHYED